MSDTDQQERSHLGKWAMWTVLILGVYVLSFAPMEALAWQKRCVWLIKANSIFYAPMYRCLEVSPSIQKWHGDYVGWWNEILPSPGDF